jgi:hypothetical protein
MWRSNYQPPQYEAKTTRKGQRLHGYATNHKGDWAPALHSVEYRENFDKIQWNRGIKQCRTPLIGTQGA